MKFETGKELYSEKLLSLRTKGTQADINAAMMALNQHLEGNSIEKAGPAISTAFSV